MSITLEASRPHITFVFIQVPQERESIDHTLRNEVAMVREREFEGTEETLSTFTTYVETLKPPHVGYVGKKKKSLLKEQSLRQHLAQTKLFGRQVGLVGTCS